MVFGLWNKARANKENIFYTVLTIFLLERVRRGWNRIESRGRGQNLGIEEIERRQHSFVFRAALLYALPFLLPLVKYVYRSIEELTQFVPGLSALYNVWALLVVVVVTEAVLAVVLYNLLGIYVERMNSALGFFRKLGRSVVDGSKVAAQAVGDNPASRLIGTAGHRLTGASRSIVRRAKSGARYSARALSGTASAGRRGLSLAANGVVKALPLVGKRGRSVVVRDGVQ
jgi:hypothetical protein